MQLARACTFLRTTLSSAPRSVGCAALRQYSTEPPEGGRATPLSEGVPPELERPDVFPSERRINPEADTVTIPTPKQREGETTEVKRARLLYQSRKRGMLENGIILSSFAARYLADMAEPQLSTYDRLINLPSNDWDIYYWVTGKQPPPPEFQSDVMDLLQQYAQNTEYEPRLIQPTL